MVYGHASPNDCSTVVVSAKFTVPSPFASPANTPGGAGWYAAPQCVNTEFTSAKSRSRSPSASPEQAGRVVKVRLGE
jgi:hypothetical protein